MADDDTARQSPPAGMFARDHDGISRRFAATKQNASNVLTAMSLQAASLVTSRPIPVGAAIAPMFRTRPQSIATISAIARRRLSYTR